MKVFEESYNWESSYDFSRDMAEAQEKLQKENGDEWPGTMKVVIEYDPEDE